MDPGEALTLPGEVPIVEGNRFVGMRQE